MITFIFSISIASYVAAQPVTGNINPVWTTGNAPYLFTSTVYNNPASGVNLSEFRIYNNTNYKNWMCNPDTGLPIWNNPIYGALYDDTFCLYTSKSLSSNIIPGQNKNFTFSATTPEGEDCYYWHLEVKDTTFNWHEFFTTYSCVDKTPPKSKKIYGEPTKVYGDYRWITNSTQITITAADQGPTHPVTNQVGVGVEKIYYRVTKLDIPDSKCVETCENEGSGDWIKVNDDKVNFNIPEDSCHLIEFKAKDKLGNLELPYNRQCVFVDTKPPETDKKIGMPSIPDEGFTWVTQDTNISLNCKDQMPHPVGRETLYWRFSTWKDGFGIGDPTYSKWFDADYTGFPVKVNFQEDCWHDLEYYCVDDLGNKEGVHTQYYIVDTAAPKIEKRMNGPYYGTCPPGVGDKCYITTETEIQVEVTDPQPHPSDKVTCKWGYNYNGKFYGWFEEGTEWKVMFKEDSAHELIIECQDALGNKVKDNETFLVDNKPPETGKDYGKPYIQCTDWCMVKDPQNYEACVKQFCSGPDMSGHFYPQWITSNTLITLMPKDEKSGVKETNYRINLVDDAYCKDVQFCTPCIEEFDSECGDFNEYTTPFDIKEDSCHLIEYFSVDNLEHEEKLKYQCVYVDNKAPEPSKEIGKPSLEGDGFTWVSQKTPIFLGCSDQNPHPVGLEKVWWRYNINGGSWSNWSSNLGNTTIYFPEDCKHQLEFYCTDGLENEGQSILEMDVVDTLPPVTKKEYTGPFYQKKVCGNGGGDSECYNQDFIDTASMIKLTAEDQEPHPVGLDSTYYRVTKVDDKYCEHPDFCERPETKNSWSVYNESFGIGEESCHVIEFYSVDKLDNEENVNYQCVFVDKTPPVTMKEYEGPQYPIEGYPKWISLKTLIKLSAHDPLPHPSGVKETWYRITQIGNDDACNDQNVCQKVTGIGDFKKYMNESFKLGEESCHMIEYYSKDNVDKTEEVKKQCVFVDDTPPTPVKDVGEPKTKWDGKDAKFYNIGDLCWNGQSNSMDCWKVTTLTPIALKCEDPQPHPSDHESVCFKVEVDGDDATEQYCSKYNGNFNQKEDGFCCMDVGFSEFYFKETSEHNLAYYCVDAVGNKGPIDDEKFKVDETAFEIQINKKWNLISVPIRLLDDSMDEVFKNLNESVRTVWTYDGVTDKWYVYTPDNNPANDDMTTMLPGWGYWILADKDDKLVIGGSLFGQGPGMWSPAKGIVKGYNLIGYYGTDGILKYTGPDLNGYGKKAKCALNSLTLWAWGFTGLWTYWEPDNPQQVKALGKEQYMNPGAGYWMVAMENGIYTPATTCNDI